MAKIEPNIQLQKPAQSESAELPATLPENVSFDSKHPLLQIKMKTRTDEKGRECINLTSAQIEEICEYVGEGATTYQRQCGLVTTWQMALQLGDTALALSVLHKMREESKPTRGGGAKSPTVQNMVIVEDREKHNERIDRARERIDWASGKKEHLPLGDNDGSNSK